MSQSNLRLFVLFLFSTIPLVQQCWARVEEIENQNDKTFHFDGDVDVHVTKCNSVRVDMHNGELVMRKSNECGVTLGDGSAQISNSNSASVRMGKGDAILSKSNGAKLTKGDGTLDVSASNSADVQMGSGDVTLTRSNGANVRMIDGKVNLTRSNGANVVMRNGDVSLERSNGATVRMGHGDLGISNSNGASVRMEEDGDLDIEKGNGNEVTMQNGACTRPVRLVRSNGNTLHMGDVDAVLQQSNGSTLDAPSGKVAIEHKSEYPKEQLVVEFVEPSSGFCEIVISLREQYRQLDKAYVLHKTYVQNVDLDSAKCSFEGASKTVHFSAQIIGANPARSPKSTEIPIN